MEDETKQTHEESEGVDTSCGARVARLSHWAFPTGFSVEFKSLMATMPTLVLTTCFQWYVQPIATIFAGHLGKVELDAIGLASTFINVLGYSIMYGMSAACDVSFSQTYGGNNMKLMGVYLQRCSFILTLMVFPCIALHLNIEGILLILGQDAEIARLSGKYLIIFLPGMFAMVAYLVLQKYFQCQHIIYPDIWMGLVAHGIHAILQYVFLYVLKWGIEGSAMAQASFYIISAGLRFAYFFCSPKVKNTWGGWSRQAFGGWRPLSQIAFYGAILTASEWWTYEICNILAGLLGTVQLGAQAILYNIVTILAAIPLGVGLSTLIQMGHQLGAGQPDKAKTTVRVGTLIGFFVGVFYLIVLMALRDYIGKVFTNEADIRAILFDVMPLMALFAFVDGMTNIGRAIYRGAAKQREAAILTLLSYYTLAVPLGVCLMLLTSLEIFGLWLGLLLCITLASITLLGRVFVFFDWNTISQEAQVRACVRAANQKQQAQDERTLLLSKNLKKEVCSSLPGDQGSLTREAHFLSMTASMDVTQSISLTQEPVTNADIVKKVLIIMAFIASVFVGLVVRLATAGLLPQALPPTAGYGNLNETTPVAMTTAEFFTFS